MNLRDIGPEWDSKWDAFAGASPESGFMQSSGWAAFKRMEGYNTWRVGLFEDSAPMPGVSNGLRSGLGAGPACRMTDLMSDARTRGSITGSGEGSGDDSVDRLIGGAGLFLYPSSSTGGESLVLCPEGPVLPWCDVGRSREGLRLIIAYAREIAKEYGGLGLRIEPHLPPPRPSLLRNWTRSPIDLTPVHTPVLDLQASDKAIIAGMQPKGRYNLHLADRHGVVVRRSTRIEDLTAFYALFTETACRGDFFREPYGFFLNLASVYFPVDEAALYFADWRNEVLSVILVIYYGRRATYLYGGSAAHHRNVMPGYALHRAAWRDARERGCVEYDLYGYDPFARPDHPYAGFSRFKRQFGPRRVDSMGAHDCLFYDRVADSLIDRLG